VDQIRETPPGGIPAGHNKAASNASLRKNSIRAIAPERQPENDHAIQISRELQREEIFEAAGEALNYLTAIRSFVATDDLPGIKYSYAKFAAYGRVVATGCKSLTAEAGR
jgi:hypothetical protein